jgi:TM2 domain-containing membrane protein YozV
MNQRNLKLKLVFLMFFSAGIISGLKAENFTQAKLLRQDKEISLYNFIREENSQTLLARNLLQEEEEFGTSWKKKSPSTAFLLSLALPGTGQLYSGDKTKAKVFLGAEVVWWGSFWLFRTLGDWKKDDYKNFAATHAGVNPNGKPDDFYSNLSFYDSRDEYNQFTRLFNGPSQPVYPEDEYWNWEWENTSSRLQYRDLRNQSKTYYRRALYSVGAAILSRIVSGLDAAKTAKKYNQKKALEQAGWEIQPKLGLAKSGIKWQLSFRKEF